METARIEECCDVVGKVTTRADGGHVVNWEVRDPPDQAKGLWVMHDTVFCQASVVEASHGGLRLEGGVYGLAGHGSTDLGQFEGVRTTSDLVLLSDSGE
jgi:hypothetical protein